MRRSIRASALMPGRGDILVDSLDRPLDPGPASVAAASAGLAAAHDLAPPVPAPAGCTRSILDSDVLYSFLRSKVTVLAALVTLAIVLGAVLAPQIAPHDPFDLKQLNLL